MTRVRRPGGLDRARRAARPGGLRDVQTRYFEAMRGPPVRHGGTVEKYIGDAVTVFGVPVLHEDDALRALRAAVEMRDGMAALNSSLHADLGVGLLCGSVSTPSRWLPAILRWARGCRRRRQHGCAPAVGRAARGDPDRQNTRSLDGRALPSRAPPAQVPGKRRPYPCGRWSIWPKRAAVSSALAMYRWWDGVPSCECSAPASTAVASDAGARWSRSPGRPGSASPGCFGSSLKMPSRRPRSSSGAACHMATASPTGPSPRLQTSWPAAAVFPNHAPSGR